MSSARLMCCSHLEPILSNTQRQETIKKCIASLTPHKDKFDSIIVSGYSMALIVPCVADALGKNLLLVRKENEDCHSEYRVEGMIYPNKHRYIIVDDFVCTGHTLRYIKNQIGNCFFIMSNYSGAELVGIYLYDIIHSAYKTRQLIKDTFNIELLNTDEELAKCKR